jgi:predicted MFS family arabinose efflux permease
MLMTGSMGMVASTLPVQWLLPQWGWRPIFGLLALLVLVAMLVLLWRLPRPAPIAKPVSDDQPALSLLASYREIWRHPYVRRHFWMGFFSYGGLLAMQTLWAGPWLVQVSGQTAAQAAQGLFWINVCMLVTFWLWGSLNPSLTRLGWHADKLIALGLPWSFVALLAICLAGAAVDWWAWALFCMASSFMSLAQPAVALVFPKELAGRALSLYNLVIFSGVFVVQWTMGLLIDGFERFGLERPLAFRAALGVFLICALAGYLRFVLDNAGMKQRPAPQ